MKKTLWIIVTAMLASALLLGGCQSKTPTVNPNATPEISNQPVKTGDRIVSEGEVVPVDYSNLSFSNSGIIGEVLVNEGDIVQAGAVIARLKGSARLQASVAAAEVELLSSQQALDNLKKNADVSRADVQLRLAQANKDLDKAKEKRDNKNYVRADQSIIDDAKAQLVLADDAYKRAEEVWGYFEGKDENDTGRAQALTVLSQARTARDRARSNLNYVEGKPDEFEVAISEGELVVAKAKYDQALRDWDLVKDGPNPDDLALGEARYNNAKAQLEAARSALADQELTAPFAGVVVSNDLKVGELVGPATPPVLLAALDNYEVKTTDLTELSVVTIKEGSPVTVTFDAVSGLELTGKVRRIKVLGEDKQGDVTYTVYVTLDQQDPRLRWKMTASVVFEAQ